MKDISNNMTPCQYKIKAKICPTQARTLVVEVAISNLYHSGKLCVSATLFKDNKLYLSQAQIIEISNKELSSLPVKLNYTFILPYKTSKDCTFKVEAKAEFVYL